MKNLEIFLLGAFHLIRGGEKVSITRRKALALLAYLAVTNQPHTREALMLLLWPEDDSGIARSNLRRTLSELNILLGKDVLSIQRDQVGLSAHSDIYVDVADFKHRVIKARQHQHSSQVGCQDCLPDLAKAVELYTGDLLAGFSLPDSRAFEEWQFFETESLHHLLAESLQTLVNWHTNLGEFDRAVEYARRFLALDPLHEPAHRLLMRLYAISGRQTAALRQYQECVQLLRKELGVKPEQETIALYEAIRSRQIVPVVQQHELNPPTAVVSPEDTPPGRPPHNLVRTSTPLVGRKEELAAILDLIGSENPCRLLTLAGPGGSGKTRLAVEAAALLADDPASPYQNGIWFISLTPVTIAKGILDKIAQILNLPIPEGGDQTRLMLLDFLRPKRMVLLLDNFEHLMDDQSISLVMEILAAAPDIKILLTSRQRLQIRDEQIIQLTGLRTPSESASLAGSNGTVSYESVQLFSQCAARLKPGFDVTPENLPAVAHICRLVEGMPLGIELAAAWIDVLSPAEIAAEIERSLDFLETDWRDLPARQHSLRAVFESSWSLITEPERQVLIALSVFQGGFTRQSAESTTGVSLKMLLALVHKSWLSQAETGRYSIHELLRQYLNEKLCANPAVYQKLMENYSSYYAGFLEGQAVVMRSSKQHQAFEAVALEYENILIAWEWFVEQKQVPTAVERMLPALFFFCTVRHKEIEFSQLAARAARNFQAGELESTHPIVPLILLTAQCTSSFLGFPNYPDIANPPLAVLEPLHKAWSLAGTSRETLLALGFWGIELAFFYGRGINRGIGIETLRYLSDHFRRYDQPWEEALALSYLGTLLENGVFTREEEEQMLDASHQALSEAVKIFDRLGDMLECGLSLGVLGNLCNRRNDRQQAIQYWLSAREKLQQGGDRSVAAHMLVQIGEAYMATCEFDSGFEYFQKGAKELLGMGYVTFAAIVVSKEALHASRYSSLEHARKARRKSIELSNQNNDTFGLAWHTWEMGELCRLEGDVLSARQWYDRASLAENTNEIGPIFYQRGLGDLAYMAGNFAEALGYFQESLRLAEQIRHDWAAAYALVGIGRIETCLGQFNAAIDRFRQAYQMARTMENMEMMLVALGGLASLCAAAGEGEQAERLAHLVLMQQRSWNETKTQAANVLHSLGIERLDILSNQASVCGTSVPALDEEVLNIEAQFTSQWRVSCA